MFGRVVLGVDDGAAGRAVSEAVADAGVGTSATSRSRRMQALSDPRVR
jgi:hypothetical protein